jgi:hypothetical protein
MKKTHTKKQAEEIIEKTMIAFDLQESMQTNPKIIKEILEEFKMDDFKTTHAVMGKLLKDIITTPQDLQPMFENIKKGLLTKHPAIIEFAELALEKGWFKPSQHVIRSIHATYILEILTATMCNSHDFFIEVQDHYREKEKTMGISSKHPFKTFVNTLKIVRSPFGTAKLLSIDPIMIYFRIQRGLTNSHVNKKEAKVLLKAKKINFIEYKLLLPILKNNLEHVLELLRINIYEAGVTEYKKGFKTNAICAHELSEDILHNPPKTIFKKKSVIPENNTGTFYKSITEKDNLFPAVELSQSWVNLYTTWNMSFILNDLDELDILFPKLVIPSIINTETENAGGARIISLWLSINHFLFRKYDKKTIKGPENKAEMAKAWAQINKKYAFDLAKKETHEDSETLKKTFNKFFSHPFFNLFRLIKIFLK